MVMQAMADVFEEGDKTAPVIGRETVLHAIEFMRYMLKCKLALLGETGEQPETPTITQPIQQHNTIFNTAELLNTTWRIPQNTCCVHIQSTTPF